MSNFATPHEILRRLNASINHPRLDVRIIKACDTGGECCITILDVAAVEWLLHFLPSGDEFTKELERMLTDMQKEDNT